MRLGFSLLLLGLMATPLAAGQRPDGPPLGFGRSATPTDLSKFFAYQPDGRTLPPGHGSTAQGREIFVSTCAMCHGDKLQGIKETGGPALIGGRGTLTHVPPMKTVESYWPYPTTLFDYIKRAMPFNAPGSLDDDQVYALVAYILAEGHVVPDGTVLDRTSLPAVVLPNRHGFQDYRGAIEATTTDAFRPSPITPAH